ncbi:MAG: 50S ribosomal protein L23 [Thiomonas sp.]
MGAITQERLLKVILAPVVSEKSTRVADKLNQVVFRVLPDATKPEIAAAVASLFKVEVVGVQVANVKGKTKRSGKFTGRRQDWKKAYVSIKPGQELDLSAGR